jgi:hypothetical protein
MQLAPPGVRRGLSKKIVFVSFALIAIGHASLAVGADETPKSEATPAPSSSASLPDTSTKRATFEMATYADTDHVTVYTPSIGMSIANITSGASLSATYLLDVVSAASVDIVSTASHRWVEARHAGSLSGQYKPGDLGIGLTTAVSSEPDYFSYTIGGQATYDFNAKNTTLILGYAYGHDTAGRSGTPFSVFSRELTRATFDGGITQVVDKATIVGLAVDAVIENGDQSKPYRYIPMFAPNVAPNVPLGASIDWVTQNRLPERPLEQLPLYRHRFAATGRYAHRFDASTIRLSERLYDDSWALLASTTDARWIFDLGRRWSIWPHARLHAQKAVSFWERAYVSSSATGWDLPEYRTGDRELGPMWTTTGGGGIKWYVGSDADPDTWALTLQGDVGYTQYLDDLYLTSRTSILGSFSIEGEL